MLNLDYKISVMIRLSYSFSYSNYLILRPVSYLNSNKTLHVQSRHVLADMISLEYKL